MFGAVTGIVVLLIIMAGIVVVFHHRKITDMSMYIPFLITLLSTKGIAMYVKN